jgi:hypothetical protein
VTQTLMAACLFVAWRLIDRAPTDGRSALAGGLLGLSLLAEISAAPLVAPYALLAWLRRRPRRDGDGGRWRAVAWLLVGPAAAVAVQLLYQRAVFGSAFASSYSRVNAEYVDPNLILGHFKLPDVRRLYWLSIHPIRGLLYCCPVFFIPLLSLLAPRLWDRRWARAWGWLVPAAVIGNFLLFNLTYNAWTAGWGVGPRYLIPIMPFLMVFAVAGYRRFPRISTALVVISVGSMLAVAAVRAQWPAKLSGPPVGDDAVAESIRRLTFGDVARDKGSFNVGQLMGLKDAWSLLPVIGVLLVVGGAIVRLRLRERAGAASGAREEDHRLAGARAG